MLDESEHFTYFDVRNLADPHAAYRRLRESDPVQWDPAHPGGAWVLTRYADVVQMFRDPRLSNDRMPLYRLMLRDTAEARAFDESLSRMMLFLDPPRHTMFRALVGKAFTPRVVEALRPKIQAVVDRCVEAVEPSGRMDVVRALGKPLPVAIIAALIGIPETDTEPLTRWSADMAVFIGSLRGVKRATQSEAEFRAYLGQLVRERRKKPREDLLSALLAAEENGERLDEADVIATCILLLNAGHETTTNLIGNGLHALLHNPEQLDRLRRSPELMPLAVEELLRYEGTSQIVSRLAKAELELGGKRIHPGQLVLCMVAAANRDPAQFEEPDRLDVGRTPNRHLAFAHGIHFCIGAHLARVETEIAIGTVVRRFPRLRLESDETEWLQNFSLRGPVALPIAFD